LDEELIQLGVSTVTSASRNKCIPAETEYDDHEHEAAGSCRHGGEHRLGPAAGGYFTAFSFELGPGTMELASFGLQVTVNANEFMAGFGIGFHELATAGRDFFIKASHF
jgi:hypothetical protein